MNLDQTSNGAVGETAKDGFVKRIAKGNGKRPSHGLNHSMRFVIAHGSLKTRNTTAQKDMLLLFQSTASPRHTNRKTRSRTWDALRLVPNMVSPGNHCSDKEDLKLQTDIMPGTPTLTHFSFTITCNGVCKFENTQQISGTLTTWAVYITMHIAIYIISHVRINSLCAPMSVLQPTASEGPAALIMPQMSFHQTRKVPENSGSIKTMMDAILQSASSFVNGISRTNNSSN